MIPKPNSALSAEKILDAEFLGIRSRLIDIAAVFDRLQRAPGSVSNDPRLDQFLQALEILAGSAPNKTEQIQLLFSQPYVRG
jgi:hypothetical protein